VEKFSLSLGYLNWKELDWKDSLLLRGGRETELQKGAENY